MRLSNDSPVAEVPASRPMGQAISGVTPIGGRGSHCGPLATRCIVLDLHIQLSQTLFKSEDVLRNPTLIACATATLRFQDIKPIKKRFALPSPFDHVHAGSHGLG